MKYIEKGPEPETFLEWKALPHDNWEPEYNSMGSLHKNRLKEALMKEQGYICCYCERRLVAEDSHIEHFKPRSDPSVDPLDYANMLCSCQNQLKKGEPRHCGNLKEDWFDASLLVSPLSPDCEQKFIFTVDGGIHAKTADEAAFATIEKLGLNIPKLNDLREKAMEPFLDETLSEQELKQFVTGYLQKNTQGMYGEFCMAIKDVFSDYIGT